MNPISPTDLIRERYGSNAFNPEHLWNETLTTLLSHRSVRAYLPDALPSQTLETLIAAAQAAATSSNLQTWSVVAIEDPARKSTLAQLAGNQEQIDQCPLFLVWLADLARLVTPTGIPAAVRVSEFLGLLMLEAVTARSSQVQFAQYCIPIGDIAIGQQGMRAGVFRCSIPRFRFFKH
jgi:hypothetical protein